MRNQNGFTLIELVVVIVILGILAAVAVPKFIDMRDEANTAALSGVIGGMSSAMSLNYAAYIVSSGAKGDAVDNCDDIGTVMEGGIPNGYTVTAAAIGAGAGSTADCTVTQTSTTNTATFTAIRTND
ncbi:prepilin-type N-terminal cleavage/methylation domain-containing protein [Pelobacter seleniigenes]|uniref:prepilin-type N-terminal cleavage/methylation domain-containing protein n=1 Tax=Pelobacter seleniigenes TaxID=407188 RepID=UPI0004A6E401